MFSFRKSGDFFFFSLWYFSRCIYFLPILSFFLLDVRSTHRLSRCVDIDVGVVVSGAPLFKYKPKRRSGQLPVGASRCSWDRHARQKAPTGRLRRSAKKLNLSSFVRVLGAQFLGSFPRGYLTTQIASDKIITKY